MKERIYFASGSPESGLAARLIRATNQAQVRKHLAKDFEIRVATQDDLLAAIGLNVAVEDAAPEAEEG